MYNVCTLYTTAVGVILARQLAVRERWFVDVRSEKYSVRFAHTAHASLMGAYAPKRSANRAWSWEDGACIIFNVCNEWRN